MKMLRNTLLRLLMVDEFRSTSELWMVLGSCDGRNVNNFPSLN